MKNPRALKALFFVVLTSLFVTAPASAIDRTNDYFGMNPSSGWWLQMERDVRLGVGQFMFNALGSNTAGMFANLAITPSTGLYVQIAPAATNGLGALYQYLPDDVNAIGSGATQLAADPTLTEIQGLLSTPSIALGPFTPPPSAGSVADLIECQVNEAVSRTPQTEYFESVIAGSSTTTSTTATANRDLADIFTCQIKVGSAVAAGATPTVPAADSGWISVATVTVPYGATTLSTSNIALNAATQFFGFIPANASGKVATSSLPHGDYIDVSSTAQTKAGSLSLGGVLTIGSSVFATNAVSSGGNVGSANGTYTSGIYALQLCVNSNTIGHCSGTVTTNSLAIGTLVGGVPQAVITPTTAFVNQGYVPPVFTSSGAATASTYHGVDGTFTCAAGSGNACYASVTLSGSAAFSGQTFSCSGNYLGQSPTLGAIDLHFSPLNATSFYYYGTGVTSGTNYTVHYVCWGY